MNMLLICSFAWFRLFSSLVWSCCQTCTGTLHLSRHYREELYARMWTSKSIGPCQLYIMSNWLMYEENRSISGDRLWPNRRVDDISSMWLMWNQYNTNIRGWSRNVIYVATLTSLSKGQCWNCQTQIQGMARNKVVCASMCYKLKLLFLHHNIWVMSCLWHPLPRHHPRHPLPKPKGVFPIGGRSPVVCSWLRNTKKNLYIVDATLSVGNVWQLSMKN